MENRLFLVDAYALIFRFYYAFMGRPMRNREGMNTSAVFGFAKFMRDIIVNEHPHYLGVAFDPGGGTFRNELYPLYKANRAETPEDIIASVPYIKRILEALRIPILEVAGYEADDVIGTLSHKASQSGFKVYMVTPDKDFGQLVRPSVFIYKQRKSGDGVEIIGPEQIREHYGIDNPELVIDILALWGDAADNIPGVAGIGEKSAMKLVCEYGTVEEILGNIDKIKGRQHDNLLASAEQLKLAKQLATISLDAPIAFEPDKLVMEKPDCDALKQIYRELDFNMFLREMESDPSSPFTRLVCPPPVRGGQSAEGESAAGSGAAIDTKPQPPRQTDLFGVEVAQVAAKVTAQASAAADLFSQESGYQSLATVEHNYHTLTDDEMILTVVEEIKSAGRLCFDVETTGFDCFGDRIVGISLCTKPFEACYIPLSREDADHRLSLLKPLFADTEVIKIGQNIKFDITMLRAAGVEVAGVKYDTMILHYLLDPESRHNMDYLAKLLLNYMPVEIESLIGKGSRQLTMDRVAVETVSEYCCEDADVTMRLYEVLWPKVVEHGADKLYLDIEEPLIDVLSDMEVTGVKIDSARLAEYGRELNRQLAELEDAIRRLAEEPALNINSSRQLGSVLFDKLKVDAKPKLTKTRQYSTEEEYLQFLADRHPLIPMVLQYRGIKKLLSTYVDALPLLVNPRTGHIHTSYNQAVTATGRLSSTNPNLQNIPVREEQGREIRRAFVPSDGEHLLLSADYSQVELRLMAHLSGDEAMINAFLIGEDIHRDTASRLFHVPLSEVTPEQRRKAKTANFGIIYGISAFGLRQRIGGISMGEAKEIIDGYFASYPKVKTYIDRVIAEARDKGYVETLFGRRRYLPDIRSANANARSLAERNAVNAPIQGSAADIIKIAMSTVQRRFRQEGIASKMILQVHDELIVDTIKSERERVETILREAMEGAVSLSVPLTVDCGAGENWLEAH